MANRLASGILRGVVGAFFLQSGYGKLKMNEEAYEGLKGMASTGIPAVSKIDTPTFGKLLAYSELGIGAALATPIIPNKLAGLALGGFSLGLLSMYFGNSDNTQGDGIRPSSQGIVLAKDSWLSAIGLALLTMDSGKGDK